MYSIDGVALANPTYGWRLKLADTNPNTGLSRSLLDFNTSGRDGTVQVRGFTSTPTVSLKVWTPTANREALRELFLYGAALTLTSDSTIAAVVELVSITDTPLVLAGAGGFEVLAVLRVPPVYWRSVSTTDYGPTSFTSSGQTFTVFAPSSAPIRDALVSIKGAVTNPTLQGANGTYLTYTGTISSSTYLTFDSNTGRAWTGSSAFAETTEVTGNMGNGRGPYFLELTGSSNPATAGMPLIVTGSSLSGATVTVRGKNAYNR